MRRRSRRAPIPTSLDETSDSVVELTFHLGLGPPDDLWSDHNHQIQTLLRRFGSGEAPKSLLQQAAGPVSRDGVADLPAHREAEPVFRTAVGRSNEKKQAPTQALALPKDVIELRSGAESLRPLEPHDPFGFCTAQAASFFRPFWRRRFRTSRPAPVRIRTRKPWVRLRFRLLGWNVLFMMIPLLSWLSRCWACVRTNSKS